MEDSRFCKAHGLATVLTLTLILAGAPRGLAAEGIDARTRDALIEKFTRVHLNLAPKDSSRNAISLRLADLLAERARISSMTELNAGCTVCVAGREDRQKAIALYEEALVQVPAAMLHRVLTQIGHLYEMTGQEKKAIETYERIIRDNKSPEAVAEAYLSLGEINFKARRFSEASRYFAKVIELPKASSRGMANYRLAWCDFNLNKIDTAIATLERILRSPELLTRTATSELAQIDTQFQEEVSRDLATVLARRPLSVKDAELVFTLSPDKAKLANLTYLASEAERLGQLEASLAIWSFAQDRQSNPSARLEGYVRLAQLEMSLKRLENAGRHFEAALVLWGQVGACRKSAAGGADPADLQCSELKARLKNFVVDWNTIEKKAPSEELARAYASYLKAFPNEADMVIWSARVAQERKNYDQALALFLRAAKLESTAAVSDRRADKIEAGLLGAIEVSELAKDAQAMNTAYEAYLAMSVLKKKSLEVRYQLAHLLYEKSEYEKAALGLQSVAMSDSPGEEAVKKQAADLSLDALALLKDNARLESWAREYAKVFPKSAVEFGLIARKAILNQAADLGSQAAAKNNLQTAWQVLSRFDLSSATPQEKAAYFKNRLILAEKLERYPDARRAADDLLSLPLEAQVSGQDREYALSRKAWLAELVLDFESALAATEKIAGGEVVSEQKWLKLAMYAELAAKDPRPFYARYLKDSKNLEKNAAIAAALVRGAKDPVKEIELQKPALAKNPELLAELYLEQYAQGNSGEIAKKAAASVGVGGTAAGKMIARSVYLGEIAKLRAKITAHQLETSTQKKLTQSLKTRIAMLDEIEKIAGRAVNAGDWTSQLVGLDLLAQQSGRFYQDVLSLPVPEGLSGEDEQQYLTLLSQQAAPHQIRAQDVGKKVSEFWANAEALSDLEKLAAQTAGPRAKLVQQEIESLVAIAPDEKKVQLAQWAQRVSVNAAAKRETPPSLMELEAARTAVRERPQDRERLQRLLSLERRMGRQAMVSYLETRIESLAMPPGGGVQ